MEIKSYLHAKDGLEILFIKSDSVPLFVIL